MKLKSINEDDYEDVKKFHDAIDKYTSARGKGNINKNKSEGNPDKTDLPDRSGNQSAVSTNKNSAKKLLGAAGNSRDKQSSI